MASIWARATSPCLRGIGQGPSLLGLSLLEIQPFGCEATVKTMQQKFYFPLADPLLQAKFQEPMAWASTVNAFLVVELAKLWR